MTKFKILSDITPAIIVISIIWILFFLDKYYALNLWQYGLEPRSLSGITGIFTMPLIHKDLKHIANNTVPLLILITILFHFYKKFFYKVILIIWILSGFWTWVFARFAFHIGASAIIYGCASFIFFSGVILKVKQHIAISLLIAFLYGSIIWGIFPVDISQSWEGHLSGFLAGTALAFFYKKDLKKVYLPVMNEDDEQDAEMM